jgi:hypothetical protein
MIMGSRLILRYRQGSQRSDEIVPAPRDLTGQRFGRLIALSVGHDGVRPRWTCKCDCGTTTTARTSWLTSGNTKSCGCGLSEAGGNIPTHGHAVGNVTTKEYRAWDAMIGRCHRSTNISYRHYGARGIRVCKEWRDDFATFLRDVGPAPNAQHTIDRINTNGDYRPGNCRWATREVQNNNTRRTVLLTYDGVTLSVTQWARRVGASPRTLFGRLASGWSVDRVLTEQHRKRAA